MCPLEYAAHHVAFTVSDIEETVAFYELLGFEEETRVDSPDGESLLVQLCRGDFLIELFWYRRHSPASPWASDLADDLRHLGIKHIGFEVDDVDLAYAEIVRCLQSPATEIRRGRLGSRYFFVTDPAGNFVEFTERRPR